MGTVLSFANRMLGSGQWTASERSRLETLTERFFGGGENVQVVFGVTDDGAPWCAVMNAEDDVLVHVARVADQFLVHFVTEDIMAKGANLREALGQWLSPEPERGGVVVPFSRVQNGANVLVLLAVATFLEDQLRLVAPHLADGGAWLASGPSVVEPASLSETDTASEVKGEGATTGEPPSDGPASHAATPQTPAESGADQAALRSQPAAVAEASAPAEAAKPDAQAAAPKEAPAELRGGDGDDVLVGTHRAERLIGGGGRDTLDGGPGNDRIVLTSQAIAYGGTGADTFVISAPAVLDNPDTLLGTIFDFNAGEGDQLAASGGELIILRRPDGEPDDPGLASKADGDQRVGIDFDGDGRADGYVLLTSASPHVAANQGAVMLVGVSPEWAEIFG